MRMKNKKTHNYTRLCFNKTRCILFQKTKYFSGKLQGANSSFSFKLYSDVFSFANVFEIHFTSEFETFFKEILEYFSFAMIFPYKECTLFQEKFKVLVFDF